MSRKLRCGTGDISFQYLQYQPTHRVLGMDASKTGIEFAGEAAKLSDYKTAVFMEGGEQSLKQLEENSFDGVILSNVLDVMPKDVSSTVIDDLERVLKPGGLWFIKMNPYYSKEELERKICPFWEGDYLSGIRIPMAGGDEPPVCLPDGRCL